MVETLAIEVRNLRIHPLVFNQSSRVFAESMDGLRPAEAFPKSRTGLAAVVSSDGYINIHAGPDAICSGLAAQGPATAVS